jgi:hypothetical protein
MVRSKLIKIQVLFFFLLIFIQIFYTYPAMAQVSEYFSYIFTSWLGWILFLAIGIILMIISFIFAKHVRLAKILFRLGAISVVISFVVAEIAYAFPLLNKEVDISYEKCKKVQWDNIPYAAACIITGYAPTSSPEKTMELVLINFWLTMLIVLFILIYMFYDLVDSSGIIGNEYVKRVMGFGFGFLAFRGFLASQIVNFLSYGLFGVALLIINFVIAGGLFAYAGRLFRKFELIEFQVEKREAIRTAEASLKEFLRNVKKAPEPHKYFIDNVTHQKALFDILGMTDEYDKLTSHAIKNEVKEFNELIENILKKLK